ncbi:hypothetical protein E2C01_028808 [Portunus trituberculatus]|uniref:Uncharacterized protein n=1 Tax=Portunus trituberculatus TaxID=210409 RepID=A0A5B7EPQ1_PORTR|nr:hypothetical protein [Portunus trituberculatus]
MTPRNPRSLVYPRGQQGRNVCLCVSVRVNDFHCGLGFLTRSEAIDLLITTKVLTPWCDEPPRIHAPPLQARHSASLPHLPSHPISPHPVLLASHAGPSCRPSRTCPLNLSRPPARTLGSPSPHWR